MPAKLNRLCVVVIEGATTRLLMSNRRAAGWSTGPRRESWTPTRSTPVPGPYRSPPPRRAWPRRKLLCALIPLQSPAGRSNSEKTPCEGGDNSILRRRVKSGMRGKSLTQVLQRILATAVGPSISVPGRNDSFAAFGEGVWRTVRMNAFRRTIYRPAFRGEARSPQGTVES